MKKSIIIALLFLLVGTTAPAQEQDPWVGDWTSESYSDVDWEATNATKDANGSIQEVIYTEYRLIIRIGKNGVNYTVRAKTIKVGDSNYNEYFPRLTVTTTESNRMWLHASEQKKPFYSNGEIDEYCDVTHYFSLTLEGEALHYTHYRTHLVNYDRRMRYKDEEDIETYLWTGNDLMLYNDDW